MRFRHRPTPPDEEEEAFDDELGAECEAYVTGRYVEHVHGLGLPVRSWTWANQAAHATWDELEAVASGDEGTGWDSVRRTLARAVLGATTPDDLCAVQTHVLVPLERRLMEEDVTPRRLLELVGDALFGVPLVGAR